MYVCLCTTIAKYQELREEHNRIIDEDKIQPVWGLRQQRICMTKWVAECWVDIVENHWGIVESAWEECGLLKRIDGREDTV